MKKTYDYIIVGQGIAGTSIAYYLTQLGKTILVVDPEFTNATQVAAGNINPITGRSYTKSWLIDELLEEALKFYGNLSSLLKLQCIKNQEIYRPLRSAKEENKWMSRVVDPFYEGYVDCHQHQEEINGLIAKPLSYGKINNAYQVQTDNVIQGYRNYLKQQGVFLSESFSFSDFKHDENKVEYKDIKAKRIVFCEGYGIKENPFFNTLPISPTKGEALFIHFDEELNCSIRDKTFVTPQGDSYWVGSNYEWDVTDDTPSQIGRSKLLDQLNEFFIADYTIVDHIAGIRPCTRDRKPVIGKHESFDNLFVFNGLGTKGTSLAPYFAKHFCAHLEQQKELLGEIDIRRFYQ